MMDPITSGDAQPSPADRDAPPPPPPRLSADRPIGRPEDDDLHRKEFIDALTADVCRAPYESGFVIGLTGLWGAGKTSVLDLVATNLEAEKRTVIRFNPWLFSGTEQLVGHFFAELTSQLEATGLRQLKRVAKALASYGKVVAPLRYLPYVGAVFGSSSRLASDLSEALGGGKKASAELQAIELRRRLGQLDRPIIVLVDDIDRLRADEIIDVVRLVRLVGDFPNLVYLIAFDRTEVEEALGGPGNRSLGRSYLEKVINLAHELPPIRPQDLTHVLQHALEDAIPDPGAFKVDAARIDNVFWANAAPLFRTVRDVRRYTNAIAATLGLIGDEVDLADVLTLEALRIFEPDAFEAILAARYALTGTHPPSGRLDVVALFARDEAANKALVTSIPGYAERDPARVERIVRQLFPLSEVHFGGSALGGGSANRQSWNGARRVAGGAPFETYLQRRIPPGEIPAREVEEVAEVLSDAEQLNTLLDRLDPEQLANLYTRIGGLEQAFPDDRRVAVQSVVSHPVGFTDSFLDMSGSMLLHQLLRGLPSGEVARILTEITYPSPSVRFAALRTAGNRGGPPGSGMLDPADLDRLETDLANAVLELEAEDLADQPELGPLIELAGRQRPDALRRHLAEWIESQRFLVELIAAHAMIKVGEYGRVVQLNWFALSDLLDEPVLRERLQKIDFNWVKNGFPEDTFTVWQQALRYSKDPSAAQTELAGWAIGTESLREVKQNREEG